MNSYLCELVQVVHSPLTLILREIPLTSFYLSSNQKNDCRTLQKLFNMKLCFKHNEIEYCTEKTLKKTR